MNKAETVAGLVFTALGAARFYLSLRASRD